VLGYHNSCNETKNKGESMKNMTAVGLENYYTCEISEKIEYRNSNKSLFR